jgi:HPt (histidine-containing phosphotransfer) domain-containing protein
LHKLKGSAGMIGATGIMQLAGQAENALESNQPYEAIESLLRQIAEALAALAALGDELQPLLAMPLQAPATASARSQSGLDGTVINELRDLLDKQDLAVIERIGSLSSALSARLGAERFNRLRDAVEELDFPRGVKVLDEANVK